VGDRLALACLREAVGETALTAVVSVKVLGHEDAWALWAELPESLDVAVAVDLVVLQGGELDLLVLVLDLLRLGVGLLLSLLSTTTESEHQVQGALLLDVVVREGAAVLKLLSGKDKTLLVRRDALLVLNLRLDVLDGVRGFDLEGDGLTRDCDRKERRPSERRKRKESGHKTQEDEGAEGKRER